MNFRLADEHDAKGIAYVQVTTWHDAYKDLMSDTVLDGMTIEKRTERWAKILADTTSETRGPTVVAEDDDEIVGFCSGGRNRDKLPNSVGEIYAMYVLKKHWGSGLSSTLMDTGVKAFEEHFDDLVLWVLKENHRAIAFYKKSGFEPDGEEKLIKFGDGEALPEIRMRKVPT